MKNDIMIDSETGRRTCAECGYSVSQQPHTVGCSKRTSLDEATPEEWHRASKAWVPAPVKAAEKAKSDGGSSGYYELPEWAKELDDLIVHKKMSWHVANIFKACYRFEDKNDPMYEINKMEWFITQLKKAALEGKL